MGIPSRPTRETARVPSTRSAMRRSVSLKTFMSGGRSSVPGWSLSGLEHRKPLPQHANLLQAALERRVGRGAAAGGQEACLRIPAEPAQLLVEGIRRHELVV